MLLASERSASRGSVQDAKRAVRRRSSNCTARDEDAEAGGRQQTGEDQMLRCTRRRCKLQRSVSWPE